MFQELVKSNIMKRFCLIILIFLGITNAYAQKDTIVIILNKNADYLYFEDSSYTTDKYYDYDTKYAGQRYFSANIKSHYLGTDDEMYAYLARVNIVEIKKGYRNWNIDQYQLKIPRTELSRFKHITTDAINTASSYNEIENLLYFNSNQEDIQYVLFKKDLNNDEITLYRVICSRNYVCN